MVSGMARRTAARGRGGKPLTAGLLAFTIAASEKEVG
jgi:hypothetical protein